MNEGITMKIAVGADPFALGLKRAAVTHLKGRGMEVVDADEGKDIPYYESARNACRLIESGKVDKALLFCGTGMGMSIAANKHAGIYAACVESVFTAKMCKAINDANVLCMGQMVMGEFMAMQAIDAWLDTRFSEGLEQHAEFLHGAVKAVMEMDSELRRGDGRG